MAVQRLLKQKGGKSLRLRIAELVEALAVEVEQAEPSSAIEGAIWFSIPTLAAKLLEEDLNDVLVKHFTDGCLRRGLLILLRGNEIGVTRMRSTPPVMTSGPDRVPAARIRLKPEFLLDSEGIVIASYIDHPRAAFGLTAQSTLAGCAVAHLTLARGTHDDGSKRRDLITLRLVRAADVKTISGDEIWLEGIEPRGYFPES